LNWLVFDGAALRQQERLDKGRSFILSRRE
jgi:hypothetical protein